MVTAEPTLNATLVILVLAVPCVIAFVLLRSNKRAVKVVWGSILVAFLVVPFVAQLREGAYGAVEPAMAWREVFTGLASLGALGFLVTMLFLMSRAITEKWT